jgi:hypothetical protein
VRCAVACHRCSRWDLVVVADDHCEKGIQLVDIVPKSHQMNNKSNKGSMDSVNRGFVLRLCRL